MAQQLAWITIIPGRAFLSAQFIMAHPLKRCNQGMCLHARIVTGCGGVGEVQSQGSPARTGRLNKIAQQRILHRKKRGMFPYETPRVHTSASGSSNVRI